MNDLEIIESDSGARITIDGKELYGVFSYKLDRKSPDSTPEFTVQMGVFGTITVKKL